MAITLSTTTIIKPVAQNLDCIAVIHFRFQTLSSTKKDKCLTQLSNKLESSKFENKYESYG